MERSDFLEEEATWDDFVEALKRKALGRLWRTHALKTFYTLQQNDAGLDDYVAAMADARYILNHGDEVIDDEQHESLFSSGHLQVFPRRFSRNRALT